MERDEFKDHYLFNLDHYSQLRNDTEYLNCLMFMKQQFPDDSMEQIFEKSLGCLVTSQMILTEVVPEIVKKSLAPSLN